jgi:hypothetical protein
MKYRISRIHAAMVASGIAGLPLFSLNAVAQIAVSSNGGKVVLVNGVVGVPANPVDDTVTIITPAFRRQRLLPSSRRHRV